MTWFILVFKPDCWGSPSVCFYLSLNSCVCLCLYFAKPDWWGLPLNTTGCRAMDSNNHHSAKHITTYIVFRAKHNEHLFEEERVALIVGKLLTSLLCCELKFFLYSVAYFLYYDLSSTAKSAKFEKDKIL